MSRSLEYLDPEYRGLPVTPKLKASLELALLRRLWARSRPDDAGLRDVAALVDKIWRDAEFPRQIAAAPGYARQYGLMYGALAPPGLFGGFHRAVLEKLTPDGYLMPFGKLPWLRLETRYYADLAGVDHRCESYRKLYEISFLANLTTVLPMEMQDAYSITHTLFHLTDFGIRDAGLTGEERARARRIVDELTFHFVAADYWDLVAELLLTQFCLGLDPTRTPSGVAAIRCLAQAQTSVGAIPGRHAGQRVTESVPAIDFFRRSYHTTLVTALVAMIILSAPSRD